MLRAEPNVFATELINLDEVADKLAAKVRIELNAAEVTKQKVAEIKSICRHTKAAAMFMWR